MQRRHVPELRARCLLRLLLSRHVLRGGRRDLRVSVPELRDSHLLDQCQPAECPPFTTSPAGAQSPVECTPLPGFYWETGARALECPANYFCPLGTTEPAPCPGGQVSSPGADVCVQQGASIGLVRL